MSYAYCQRSGDRGESLLEQRDRLIRASRPVRRRHRQEDRAEPIRDVEMRVERRREIEQRLEQLEAAGRARGSAVAAEVLDRRGSSRRRPPSARNDSTSRRAASPDVHVQQTRRRRRRADRRSSRACSTVAATPRPAAQQTTTAAARRRARHLNSRREKTGPRRDDGHRDVHRGVGERRSDEAGGTRMPWTTWALTSNGRTPG